MLTIKANPTMRIWKSIGVSLVIGSALAITACSMPMPAKPAAQATNPKPAAAAQSATAAKPMIMLHNDAKLGKILVDAKGMVLYIFDKDSVGKSNCSGDCLVKWPIVTASDAKEVIAVDKDVNAKLGVIKRDDGKFQVTAGGMPLYYFVNDKAAGDVTGQAVGNVWWVVGADGKKIGG